MRIQDMFERDINRDINGVVKVAQEDDDSLEQELSEYVITRELAGHFATFFDAYERALDVPTDKIGVWISGFFGSGKSHFLKMLSYLLTNREVAGRTALDYFHGKFEDGMVAAKVDRCAHVPTESILFNVDSKAVGEKDADVLRRTFARVFYDHLGFYGEDLKLARLEQFVDSQGKTDAFRSAFERVNGERWLDARAEYDFFSDDVIAALVEADVMSEDEAQRWFDGSDRADFSIERLTDEVRDYAEARAAQNGGQFRLLFMVDEIGQFIGSDTNLMLNLQTIVEELGSKCAGRVWVMVTSQEAIDEVTTVAGNDFSKIQGRFNTRLSLSSSSADEVIKRRVLAKTPDATSLLAMQYGQSSAVLRNLFTFEDAVSDLHGYDGAEDFAETFPFADYQFTLMQKVMTELRKHGSSGKHLSSGERSMLSGFQEAAQRVEERDENALVPFWMFYDTVQTFLEGHIRRVINRAEEAAAAREGLEQEDVPVLKLLFLLRWVDDVKLNVGNIVTLMTDDVRADRMALRERVQASLERLVRENYVSRNGETYQFLTDDEQEIARLISRAEVDSARIVRKIADIFYGDVFPAPKLAVGENNFPVEEWVDETRVNQADGLTLRVMTALAERGATDRAGLILRSSGGEAIVVLSDEIGYYDCLLEAAKIDRFVSTQNIANLPENQQRIIREKNQERTALERRAKELIEEAVRRGAFYAAGEEVRPTGTTSARKMVEECVARLVDGTYPKLSYIDTFYHSDAEIRAILNGQAQALEGQQPNQSAIEEVDAYLGLQSGRQLTTTMEDVQKRFGEKPYGWREPDIAAVVAELLVQGRAKLRYAGAALDLGSPKAIDCLRKKSEVRKATIERRVFVSEATRLTAREAVMDFCHASDVPTGEDELTKRAHELLVARRDELNRLLDVEYRGHEYPGRSEVANAIELLDEVLSAGLDPTDLLPVIARKDDDLADTAEGLEDVESFFSNQRELFDRALRLIKRMAPEHEYLASNEEATQALVTIRDVLSQPRPYRCIRELAPACQTVEDAYNGLLSAKKTDMLDQVKDMYENIKSYAESKDVHLSAIAQTELERRNSVNTSISLTALDALKTKLSNDQRTFYADVDREVERRNKPVDPATPPKPKKHVRYIGREKVCPPELLSNSTEVDVYVEKVRKRLLEALDGNDAIQLS